jgi:hypothetical protein
MKRRAGRVYGTEVTLENVDYMLTMEVQMIKQRMVCKRPKMLTKVKENIGEEVYREGDLEYWRVKKEIFDGANVISLVAKINE